MKVSLIFPPDWLVTHPYLSLPCLAACLRKSGIPVCQRDINVEAWDILMSSGEITTTLGTLERRLKSSAPGSREYEALLPLVISGESIAGEVERAKEVMRGRDFYDLQEYMRAHSILKMARLLVYGAHNPTELVPQLQGKRWAPRTVDELLERVEDRRNNTFAEVFERHMVDSILAEAPDMVGISITDVTQAVPGLTLARMIKDSRPHVHVVIGGNIFTRWQDVLLRRPDLFSLFDSVIVREGETAMLELVEQLSGGRDLDKVPNLIYWKNGSARRSRRSVVEDLDALPTPDFNGLPLHLYLSPTRILPAYASRGCYWGRCAFCDHGYGYGAGYRVRKPETVCDDLSALSADHGTNIFTFVDELMSPALCKSISTTIKERELKIDWTADARFETGLTPQLLLEMAQSGCRVLYWGLESGSDRVLDLMEKGTTTRTIRKICRDSTEAGIWNHLFVFFGFPGETREEALATMELVLSNHDTMQTVGAGPFTLNRHSRIAGDPERYDVKLLDGEELLMQHRYEAGAGLTEEEAAKISELFEQRMKTECGSVGLWGIMAREHLLLYIASLGRDRMASLGTILKEAVTTIPAGKEDPA